MNMNIDTNLGLGGKTSHQSCGSIAGVVLLYEGNSGVDEQKHHNTNEVRPIRRLALFRIKRT